MAHIKRLGGRYAQACHGPLVADHAGTTGSGPGRWPETTGCSRSSLARPRRTSSPIAPRSTPRSASSTACTACGWRTGPHDRIRLARPARPRCAGAISSSASSATATAPAAGRPRSFTEIEYDTAVATGLPRLMFVATDDFHVPVKVLRSESPEQAQRQEAFRKRVLAADTAARNFSTPERAGHRCPRRALERAATPQVRAPNEPERQPSAPSPAASATSSAARRSSTSSAPP